MYGRGRKPPDLPYKIHGDQPRGRREEYGPVGHLRRHGFPREVSEGACRVQWSGVAVNTTNRVRQCVFSPSHTGYMAARPGTSIHGCFRPERPRPATPLGMHPQTPPAGSRAAGGARRGRPLPAGPGGGPHVFCMGGRGLSASPIQIV